MSYRKVMYKNLPYRATFYRGARSTGSLVPWIKMRTGCIDPRGESHAHLRNIDMVRVYSDGNGLPAEDCTPIDVPVTVDLEGLDGPDIQEGSYFEGKGR